MNARAVGRANFAAPVVQASTALIADSATERVLEVSAERNVGFEGHAARGIPGYRITLRASGNNDRLSTLWREVISLAGVAKSFSKSSPN